MTNTKKSPHHEIERLDIGGKYIHRTIAANGEQVGRQSETVNRLSTCLRSLRIHAEAFNGQPPYRVKLIGCKLPKKERESGDWEIVD